MTCLKLCTQPFVTICFAFDGSAVDKADKADWHQTSIQFTLDFKGVQQKLQMSICFYEWWKTTRDRKQWNSIHFYFSLKNLLIANLLTS